MKQSICWIIIDRRNMSKPPLVIYIYNYVLKLYSFYLFHNLG